MRQEACKTMAATTDKATNPTRHAPATRRAIPARRPVGRDLRRKRRKSPPQRRGAGELGDGQAVSHQDGIGAREALDGDDGLESQDAMDTGDQASENANKPGANEDRTSFLSMYFQEMAALDVLRPEQEYNVAREIEAREITVWTELLGYAPVVGRITATIADIVDKPPAELRALADLLDETRDAAPETLGSKSFHHKLARAVRSCAEKLHASDTDKLHLDAVLALLPQITRAASQGAAPPLVPDARDMAAYVERVHLSERAAREARNEFVKANLRLVVSIARRFNHGRMALADLIQEGNLGLMKAVERYDYRRGFRFSTYASWWIRHAISRAIADKGREVRLPVHMLDAHQRLMKAQRQLTSTLGRQPTNEELAEATKMSVPKIEKMRSHLFDQVLSLDRPVNDEDGHSLVDLIQESDESESSTVDALSQHALATEVRRALQDLRPIEADVLRRRFGLDDDEELTLKQIGEQYNLSRERIRQIQEQALTKMRQALRRKALM